MSIANAQGTFSFVIGFVDQASTLAAVAVSDSKMDCSGADKNMPEVTKQK